MALPKLEAPKHSTVLPSTGETVIFRPFLVGEQKQLLIAQESEDNKQQIREMMRLIDVCCDDLKAENIPTSDVEWLFLQIRIKSVGETSDVVLKCEKEGCEADNETTVDLESVKVIQPEKEISPVLELTPSVSIELQYPGFKQLEGIEYGEDGSIPTSQLFNLIASCIISVIDEDEVHGKEDFTQKEVGSFVDSMSIIMLDQIQEYFDNIPKLVINQEFNCSACNHNNNIELEGTQNFFD